jgi:hypothetical protein
LQIEHRSGAPNDQLPANFRNESVRKSLNSTTLDLENGSAAALENKTARDTVRKPNGIGPALSPLPKRAIN